MSEKIFLRRLKEGDEEAFEELIDKFQGKIFSLINLMVSQSSITEDLAQEVFLRIFKGIPYFREESKLSTWIYRITYNVCLAEIEKHRKSLFIIQNERLEKSPDNLNISLDKQIEKIDFENKIRKILDLLPVNYKIVLILFYWQELSYQEIAETMKIPMGTVKTYLYRAKNLLKQKILEEKNEL
ncbi:MAG: RNA polymerase sigma factor [Candidatus Aminicenantia bacterium]